MEKEQIDTIARPFVESLMIMEKELSKIEDIEERTDTAKYIVSANIRIYLHFFNQRSRSSRDILLNTLRVLYRAVEAEINNGDADHYISKYNQMLDEAKIDEKTRTFRKFDYLPTF